MHGHILAFEAANASSSGRVLGATRSGSVSCASGRDGSLCQISLRQAPARAQKAHSGAFLSRCSARVDRVVVEHVADADRFNVRVWQHVLDAVPDTAVWHVRADHREPCLRRPAPSQHVLGQNAGGAGREGRVSVTCLPRRRGPSCRSGWRRPLRGAPPAPGSCPPTAGRR